MVGVPGGEQADRAEGEKTPGTQDKIHNSKSCCRYCKRTASAPGGNLAFNEPWHSEAMP